MTRASASGPTISGSGNPREIFRCSASGNEENEWD